MPVNMAPPILSRSRADPVAFRFWYARQIYVLAGLLASEHDSDVMRRSVIRQDYGFVGHCPSIDFDARTGFVICCESIRRR